MQKTNCLAPVFFIAFTYYATKHFHFFKQDLIVFLSEINTSYYGKLQTYITAQSTRHELLHTHHSATTIISLASLFSVSLPIPPPIFILKQIQDTTSFGSISISHF